MPIIYRHGDMFESGAHILVNPVNCRGVAGAGVAKQFAKRFPVATRRYKRSTWRPGFVHFYSNDEEHEIRTPYDPSNPVICCIATKDDWRDPSSIQWIREGLHSLSLALFGLPDHVTIAMPAIGCGLGGLEWDEVKECIEEQLKHVNQIVYVYEPK